MNLTSTLASNYFRSAEPEGVAILYPMVGNVLRVPLRRTRTGGIHGCAQHPERQFIAWFNRMAGARPGFPTQIKSILLVTGEPLCASCYRALAGYLSRFHLAGKLRLRTTAPAACGCGGQCGCGSRPAGASNYIWPNALLSEDDLVLPALGSPLAPAPLPAMASVDKHKSPAFKRAKADLKRDSIDNPDLPKADRGWLKQERKQRGNNPRKWRNPPGKDVGHVDPKDNTRVRWEGASQNRSRGAKFKRELESIFPVNPFSREFELLHAGEMEDEGFFGAAADWVRKKLAERAVRQALDQPVSTKTSPYDANPDAGRPVQVAPVRNPGNTPPKGYSPYR